MHRGVRNSIGSKYHVIFFLPISLLSIFIYFLVRSTVLGDDVINVVTKIAFFIFDNHFFDFIHHNRDLNLNDPCDWYVYFLFGSLSLTKLFRIGQFGLRNQTLVVPYFTEDYVLISLPLSLLRRRIIQSFLDTQISKLTAQTSIVSLQIVLLKFSL